MCRLRGTSPGRLLALDRLEERLEVALAEPPGAAALDHLVEEGGAVSDRTGEELEQVSVLLEVDEDTEVAQLVEVLADAVGAGEGGQLLVVCGRCRQELHAAVA